LLFVAALAPLTARAAPTKVNAAATRNACLIPASHGRYT
jgi:hypothetical protein